MLSHKCKLTTWVKRISIKLSYLVSLMIISNTKRHWLNFNPKLAQKISGTYSERQVTGSKRLLTLLFLLSKPRNQQDSMFKNLHRNMEFHLKKNFPLLSFNQWDLIKILSLKWMLKTWLKKIFVKSFFLDSLKMISANENQMNIS